ncbi:hypothetical protein SAMN05892877_109266 [Rhizobium subbaraonis]|uniref:Uncharacterized protein n=1 Tax=Rhizobium subbaraonis TaxID=908946 RepID=A0A285UPP0_9HYPH|nr:hypothetical protein [Rhizobium subbaraonis]SOC42231.1 hypothetical protein SAMN05892877_109266 [Rhizobium subbaraonis]
MKTVALAIVVIGACLAWSSSPAHAAGLECPRLAELDTPADPAEVDRLGAKGLLLEQPAELQAAAAFLREQGLSADDSINHLIAFYCPSVAAEAGLSDDEKAARLRAFAAQASRAVLAESNVEDLVFHVPLDPKTAAAVSERASKAGVTPEEWIAQTIEGALR